MKSNRPRVTNAVMTCSACPSQWDIWLEDGTYVYARYRWGCLTVDVMTAGPEWYRIKDNQTTVLYDGQLGDGLDGYMTTAELAEHTADILDWSDYMRGVGNEPTI